MTTSHLKDISINAIRLGDTCASRTSSGSEYLVSSHTEIRECFVRRGGALREGKSGGFLAWRRFGTGRFPSRRSLSVDSVDREYLNLICLSLTVAAGWLAFAQSASSN